MKTPAQVSQTTLDAYAQMGPWKDQDSNYLVLALVDAIASLADVTEQFTRDDPTHAGWGQVMDVNVCPSVALPWLAQFAGVVLPTGVTDANARTLITGQGNMKRGTVAAMTATAQALLSGSQRVDIYERLGGPYLLKLVTYLHDTPGGANGATAAAVLAAITAQKPAGLILSYVVQSGPTWNQMAGFPVPTAGRWMDETDTWNQLSNEDPVNP